jgi:hypothetical protein
VTKFGLGDQVAVYGSPSQIAFRTAHVLGGMLLFMAAVILTARISRLHWLRRTDFQSVRPEPAPTTNSVSKLFIATSLSLVGLGLTDCGFNSQSDGDPILSRSAFHQLIRVYPFDPRSSAVLIDGHRSPSLPSVSATDHGAVRIPQMIADGTDERGFLTGGFSAEGGLS